MMMMMTRSLRVVSLVYYILSMQSFSLNPRHTLSQSRETFLAIGLRAQDSLLVPLTVGEPVTAKAKYIGRNGKLYEFEISAKDARADMGRECMNGLLLWVLS
jgi:predicted thioesterase